nr:Uncharacterised protein [Klebsiella pneumoniae]
MGAGFRQLGRHRQVAGGAGEVADGGGADAEAERRHHVIEKTVVVIGSEEHYQLGIEFSDPPPGVGNHPVHFIKDRLLRVYESHQRGVGETVQIGMHIRPPSLQRGRYPRLRGPFFRQSGQLRTEGLRDGESGDKAVRPDHGDGGVMQCKPAFEAVLRIAHPQRAGALSCSRWICTSGTTG